METGSGQLFISYSRRDRDFVERLHAALVEAGRDAYVDWEDIPAWSPDYERELMQAIDTCDTFLFVLSSESVTSANCSVELERATAQGKRIRPLLRREVDADAVPEALRRPQWIDFSSDERFDEATVRLLESVDVDADRVRIHTRIGLRATEWDSRRRDASLLLRGGDLREAETWLAEQAGKEPSPTQLQAQYVAASRRGATRRQRIALSVVLFALVVAVALAAYAVLQRNTAITQRDRAFSLALASAADRQPAGEFDVSLQLSLEAYHVRPTTQATSSMMAALVAARRSGAETILRAHQGAVASVAFSPDGHTLASGGGGNPERDALPAGAGDGSLRLWDLRTLKPLGHRLTGRHLASGEGVAFSPDGHTLAGISGDGAVQLWDLRRPDDPGPRLDSHQGYGWGIAFSPDGHTVAAAVGQQGMVELWDVRTPTKPGRRLTDRQQGIVWAVAFSPDGRTLAAAGGNGTIRLWDLRHPSRAGRRLQAGTTNVWAVAFSPDGRELASGTEGGVQLWDLRRPTERAQHLLVHQTVYGLAFSPDSRTLLAAGGDISVFDLRRPVHRPRRLDGLRGPVLALAFSPDGHTFASAGGDGTVRLWNTRSHAPITQPLNGYRGAAADGAAFGPDGHTLALASRSVSGEHATVRVWDVRRPTQRPRTLDSHQSYVGALGFSPGGQTLASGGEDGTIWLWDVRNPQRHRRLLGPRGEVTALAFSPDGHTLASANGKRITLWDLRQPHRRGPTLDGARGAITDIAFSPDGHTVASAGADGAVWLWDDRKPGQSGRRLDGIDEDLHAVVFSPDGRTLASGGTDRVVRLWDVRKHTQLADPLEGHRGSIKDIAFSPDGHTLASASVDGTVRFWNLHTHTQIGPALNGGEDAVVAVAISPDGHTVVSAGDFGGVVVRETILWTSFDDLRATVCRLVPVDLTKTEWKKLAPGLPHETSCGS